MMNDVYPRTHTKLPFSNDDQIGNGGQNNFFLHGNTCVAFSFSLNEQILERNMKYQYLMV